MEYLEPLARVIAVGQIAAVIALLNGLFTAFGQARVAAQAIESIARQPEASGAITRTMFAGLAMSETSGIYGMVIAIIMLFANPLVGRFIDLIPI